MMKLVSSNDVDLVRKTVHEALEHYRQNSDISAALDILVRLKGIGPATASLLLAVLDPKRVIFFADEAFYWLCCGGKKAPIKYNAKEYRDLTERARSLCKRLKVRAVDVEKVAFVLLREQDGEVPEGKSEQSRALSPPKVKRAEIKHVPAKKRKALSAENPDASESKPAPERRSKRIQRAKQA